MKRVRRKGCRSDNGPWSGPCKLTFSRPRGFKTRHRWFGDVALGGIGQLQIGLAADWRLPRRGEARCSALRRRARQLAGVRAPQKDLSSATTACRVRRRQYGGEVLWYEETSASGPAASAAWIVEGGRRRHCRTSSSIALALKRGFFAERSLVVIDRLTEIG